MNPGSLSPANGSITSRGLHRGGTNIAISSTKGSSPAGNTKSTGRSLPTRRTTTTGREPRKQPTGQGQANDRLEQLKKDLGSLNRDLRYEVALDENVVQAKIVNTSTDEVIKEIPPDEIISLRKKIDEFLGLLIDERR